MKAEDGRDLLGISDVVLAVCLFFYSLKAKGGRKYVIVGLFKQAYNAKQVGLMVCWQ